MELEKTDIEKFEKWLQLDVEAITWQGRNRESFDKVWNGLMLQLENQPLNWIFKIFDLLKSKVNIGPILSWFDWLLDKYISFIFLYKDLSIIELSEMANRPVGHIALTLRNYFLERFPEEEQKLSSFFHISNEFSSSVDRRVENLKKYLGRNTLITQGTREDEILRSLEITLYEDWDNIVSLYSNSGKNKNKKKNDFSREKRRRFIYWLRDFAFLMLFGYVSVVAIIHVNKWYQKHLADKISIYEPQLKWLNHKLVFQEKVKEGKSKFNLNVEDLEKAEIENRLELEIPEEEKRYETESETILTSIDSQQDIDTTDGETSLYEEVLKRGYRDTRYGRTKVYRIMIRSSDTATTTEKLKQVLSQFPIEQVDNVRPGTMVPGGHYYNIYVPREKVKEFISGVTLEEDSRVYQSRTSSLTFKKGHDKVFIWVKSI